MEVQRLSKPNSLPKPIWAQHDAACDWAQWPARAHIRVRTLGNRETVKRTRQRGGDNAHQNQTNTGGKKKKLIRSLSGRSTPTPLRPPTTSESHGGDLAAAAPRRGGGAAAGGEAREAGVRGGEEGGGGGGGCRRRRQGQEAAEAGGRERGAEGRRGAVPRLGPRAPPRARRLRACAPHPRPLPVQGPYACHLKKWF